jgi:hypothetical protein
VFLDETGHEDFQCTSVFGYCGVVAYGADYVSSICPAWAQLKLRHAFVGPVHGSELEPGEQKALIQDIGAYLTEATVGRFAAMVSTRTELTRIAAHEAALYGAISAAVRLIGNLASTNDVNSVVFIFEHSSRLEARLRERFAGGRIHTPKGALGVWPIAIPKRSAEPGLELADLVANAAHGRATRRAVDPFYVRPRKDFDAVFHPKHKGLVDYRDIDKCDAAPTWGPPGVVLFGH